MAKKDVETIPLDLQGGNLTKVKKDAKKLWNTFLEAQQLIDEQKEIQDGAKEALVAMGIPRSSFAEVRRKHKMSAEKRAEHNFGVQIMGEAIGLPTDDLFGDDEVVEEPTVDDPKSVEPKKAKPGKGVSEGEAVGLDGRTVPLE